MKLSCKEMYSNPTGKGSSNVISRYRIRESLSRSFVENLKRYRNKFMAQPYLRPDGSIVMWVKVPSRTFKDNGIVYDVIIEIEKGVGNPSLRPAKFFVNSPSFLFTYAYVFNKEDLLIDWLSQRMPQQALTTPPTVRNPNETLGYELILYQALAYCITGGCLTDSYIDRMSKLFDAYVKLEIQAKVSSPEKLINVYNHALYMHRKNHIKPLDSKTKSDRDKELRDFKHSDKYRRPHITFKERILAKNARSKINAKQAKKALLDKKPKTYNTSK